MPHATSSLSYTQNGSTDDPSKPRGLSLIHRVSDTPAAHVFDLNQVWQNPILLHSAGPYIEDFNRALVHVEQPGDTQSADLSS
jgi:hypothetical protein